MSETSRPMNRAAGGGRRVVLSLLSVVVFVGVALIAMRSPLPPGPSVAVAGGQKDQPPAGPTPRAVAAATAFLDALDDKQRAKAQYDFGSNKKSTWSNLPATFVPRNGVALGDLTKEQRDKAMAVLAAVLSKEGYQKVIDIMDGDQLLAEGKGGAKGKGKAGGKGPMFGKDLYYLAIFGKPSEMDPWMVQFGGHHLGLNVTVVGKHFVLTPSHTGTQPALFKRVDKEIRPLGHESDAAFKLLADLDDKQRAQAVIGDRPQGELLLGPGRDDKTIEPKGVKGSVLTIRQQELLLDVISAWVNIVEPETAKARMAEIKDRIKDTYFAWSGPTEKGSAAYFRVQGPAVVIEYAPQGGTDHIHTVIRNPQDEYGAGSAKR